MKAPQFIGRYEVVDLIGRGGMGSVYRARDPRIGRHVAIKLLRESYDSPDLRERFSREAKSAGRLSHPNIVTIYDIGEHEGLPFIAMEYVPGETFATLIDAEPPLTAARTLALMEAVCAGLAHAHRAGIIHRDIKPANLIVGSDGGVKILDFGIAKLIASGMTLPGSVMGTLNYMSPEQAAGTFVDARSDIFAVGAVLYELLSQRQAFPGENYDEVLHCILHTLPTPLSDYCPELDPRLASAVAQALEKDPARRFQNIESLQRELVAIRLGALRGPRPPLPQAEAGNDLTITIASTFERAAPRPTPTPTERDREQLRLQEIEGHLSAAGSAFDSGDYDAAMESCKQVLVLAPNEARATSEIERIHAAIDERQVQRHIADARQRLARRATTAASESLDAASALAPGHPDVSRVRQEIASEVARARAATMRAALGRARAAYEADDLTLAMRELEHSLAIDPKEADALALRIAVENRIAVKSEEARVRAVVDDARRRFDSGEHETAIRALEALEPASAELAVSALNEMRLALREIEEQRRLEQERVERQQRVAAGLADVRAALDEQRLDAAADALQRLQDIDPTVPDLPDLTKRLREAQAAARLNAEIESALVAINEQLERGDLRQAGDLVRSATSLAPADPRLLSARQRFEEATAARVALEFAEAQRREGERQIGRASELLDEGDLAAATQTLQLASELSPEDPRIAELSARIQEAIDARAAADAARRLRLQVEGLLRSASQRLLLAETEPAGLALAAQDVNQALALAPDDQEAQHLQEVIDDAIAAAREAARVRATINNARSRFANGKHRAAIQLLEEFQPASNPAVADTLTELRAALKEIEEQRRLEQERVEREQRATALVGEARAAMEGKRYDEALAVLAGAQELAPTLNGLLQLVDEARRARAAALAAAHLESELSAALAALDGCLTGDDLDGAEKLLQTASSLSAADPRVLSIRQRVEAEIADRSRRIAEAARRQESSQKTDEAVQLVERGDLPGAAGLLQLAITLDSQNARAASLAEEIRETLARQAAANAAERLRREQERDAALRTAGERLTAGDFPAARRTLAGVLENEPTHAEGRRLLLALERAEGDAQKAADQRRRVAEKGLARAAKYTAQRKLPQAVTELEDVLRAHPGNDEVAARLVEARSALANQQRAESIDALFKQSTTARSHGEAIGLLLSALEIAPADERVQRALRDHQAAASAEQVERRREPDLDLDLNPPSQRTPARVRPARVTPAASVGARAGARGGVVVGIAAVAIVVLAILVVPLLRGRPAPEPVVPSGGPPKVAEAPAVQPNREVTSSPSGSSVPPAVFTVMLTGKYPFEVLFPGGTEPAADKHMLTLPAGTAEIRLRNREYFLDQPVSVAAEPGETITRVAPALTVLTVYVRREVCAILIDGRSAGFHPLKKTLVVGPHTVSTRCPDGTTQSKRVVVAAGRPGLVTFTEAN